MTDIVDELMSQDPFHDGVGSWSNYNRLFTEAAKEIKRLRLYYGVVANPERLWQGKCGHLWHHEGGEPQCPVCSEVEQLRAQLARANSPVVDCRNSHEGKRFRPAECGGFQGHED